MAIEETCRKLNLWEVEELRAETNRLLKQKQPPNIPNITKEEYSEKNNLERTNLG